MSTKKAIGQRGSWFARIGGKWFPCVHKHWYTKGGWYRDPGYQPDCPKWRALVRALREEGKAILTTDRVSRDGLKFERNGYVALFSIEDVRVSSGFLEFRFVERLSNLK